MIFLRWPAKLFFEKTKDTFGKPYNTPLEDETKIFDMQTGKFFLNKKKDFAKKKVCRDFLIRVQAVFQEFLA